MYGHRGSICAHFGWTWEYIHWGIRWGIIQRMLIDAPKYENEEKKDDKNVISLSSQNNEALANYINSIKV